MENISVRKYKELESLLDQAASASTATERLSCAKAIFDQLTVGLDTPAPLPPEHPEITKYRNLNQEYQNKLTAMEAVRSSAVAAARVSREAEQVAQKELRVLMNNLQKARQQSRQARMTLRRLEARLGEIE